MASLRKVGKTYYVRYRINGREYCENIGKNIPKTVASRLLRQFEEKLALQKLGLKDPELIAICDYLDLYLEWVSKNQAKKTFEIKKGARKTFASFLSQREHRHIVHLNDITTPLIEKYKMSRLNDGVSNRTINIELNFLSNCIVIAKEWGYRVGDVKIKRLREVKKIPRYFSQSEIKILLGNASKYLHQIITISLFTGLRINELLNLKWDHVDFGNNLIRISNTASFQTKTRRDRIIPMNSYLKTYLIEMKQNFVNPNTDLVSPRAPFQMGYVVCGKYGERIGCVRKAYKRLLAKLGIKDASLHTLRHTFASMCIMNNVDLYTIKEFLGHSRVTTTEIYTHISQEFKLSSIERLTGVIADR